MIRQTLNTIPQSLRVLGLRGTALDRVFKRVYQGQERWHMHLIQHSRSRGRVLGQSGLYKTDSQKQKLLLYCVRV